MMNVIPTKMNANEDEIQSAMLHHLMQRLSLPTFLQQEGQFHLTRDLFLSLRVGVHLLGSLKSIIDRIGPVRPVLEIFSHPTEYDRYASKLQQFGIIGDFLNAIESKKTLVCPVR